MGAGSSTVAGQRPADSELGLGEGLGGLRASLHPRAPGLTLWQAFIVFTHARSARIMAVLTSFAIVARLWVGEFSGWDLVVLAALVALHPFTEWVIHVGVLHWRPRKVGRFVIDTDLAHKHRLHHESPHTPKYWYTPMRGALIGFALAAGVVSLVVPTFGLWLTYVAGAATIGLLYEWTHYLCHTSYRPRGRWYRRLWRHHRFHHFKNEHYWMGVTMHLGDWVLRTKPSPKDVPTSPTCRDLLGS